MLDIATRFALGPILLAQAHWLRRTTLELPEAQGPRRGIVGHGEVRLRLLVVGDSSAAGVGARTQRQALARPLAERLAHRLAGSVRWQLVARSGLTSEGVYDELVSAQPPPVDVAVVVVGVNDITKDVPLAIALKHRSRIANWIHVHCEARHVIFPALPEMEKFPAMPKPLSWYAGQAARRNNRAQRRWAAQQAGLAHVDMDGITHASLFCEDGFHPAPALYAKVADRLADDIVARGGETRAC